MEKQAKDKPPEKTIRTNAERIQSLPTNEFQGYKESFRFFDRDAKGFIVPDDFRRALRDIQKGTNPTDEEIDSLMREYDPNNRGRVLFEDLVVATVKRRYGYEIDRELVHNFKYITFKNKVEADEASKPEETNPDESKPAEKEASGS